MPALQLSGLSSGFDWKSFVDQLISLERTPASRMESEIANNQLKITALASVETRINDLRAAAKALNADGVFDAQSATVTGTDWTASSDTTALPGAYSFNVTQRATSSTWTGAGNIGNPLAPTSDVSGLTLASLGTATAPTAGVVTVNGARVTIGLSDSLQDVFNNISTATGGTVTGAYNAGTDRITLTSSGGPVVLGSSNDTSNLLSALRLANNGSGSVSSAANLGTASSTATLANARLTTAVTAVDGSGNGTFSVNGTEIAYNINTDNLGSVISRINASTAGVTATMDPLNDRMLLTNKTTGDVGISISESAGGLMGALGLTAASGASLTRGLTTQFSVNGGPTVTSSSNILTSASHGITGLTVTAGPTGTTETVTVKSDTSSARAKIDTFISAFNSFQSYVDSQTKITSSNGKVTAATLSSNREVQNWASQLRSSVFASVPGLSTTLSRLDHLGIDFSGTEAALRVKDSAKLEAALKDRPTEVSALFRQASTGLAPRLETLFTSYVGLLGGSGLMGNSRTSLTNNNTSLTKQIADIERRLVQRRAILESSFIAMETAQSQIKTMQSQLTSAFSNKSSQ